MKANGVFIQTTEHTRQDFAQTMRAIAELIRQLKTFDPTHTHECAAAFDKQADEIDPPQVNEKVA